MKKIMLFSLLTLGTITGMMMNSSEASAHGFVESPVSRGYAGALAKDQIGWSAAFNKYGNVITNPQSLEAPKGFPEAGPADGRIASANGGSGQIGDFVLDQQSADRWDKRDMTGGKNVITWKYTAPHSTSQWRYFITKKGWDPNDKLDRGDFELIETVKHDGSAASNNLSHVVNVPTDRSGYHVILAVWDVADTPNAFYNVIDVNLKNDGLLPPIDTQKPSIPGNIKASNITTNSVDLAWDASEDNQGVKEYIISRDGKEVARTTKTTFKDTELKAAQKYTYTVQAEDLSGNVSEVSQAVSITTAQAPAVDTEAPTAPTHLHSMGETTNSVSLMWGKATDNVGVATYNIYRDGKKVAATKNTSFMDAGLKANTSYRYTVTAVDAAGNESVKSNELTVKTKEAGTIAGNEWKAGSFSHPILYTKGDIVTYKGLTYKVLQTHNNYGDTTWAPDQANTLFQKV